MEDPKDREWRAISGDFALRPNRYNFPTGMPCRRIYEQVLTLPCSLVKSIAVTLRRFNESVYISELRFIYEHDEILMGYVIPHKEKSLSLEGGHLTGLITAIGARGIMALRTVSENGHVSDWLGNPDGLPVSVRICMRSYQDAGKMF